MNFLPFFPQSNQSQNRSYDQDGINKITTCPNAQRIEKLNAHNGYGKTDTVDNRECSAFDFGWCTLSNQCG